MNNTEAKNRDGALDLAGSLDSVSPRFAAGDPVSIGDLAAVIVSDLAVRLRGDFQLPRLVVSRPLGGVETD